MFNEGVRRLIDGLPELAGLDRLAVRRLLSGAWLDAVRQKDLGAGRAAGTAAGELRRLATALEVRLFVGENLDEEPRRAASFVAAEALGVVRDLSPSSGDPEPVAFGSVRRFELVEEALLYLTAGFDANAALTAANLGDGTATIEVAISNWALERIQALLDGFRAAPDDAAPDVDPDASLRDRVRHEIWRRIGASVGDHVGWLRMLVHENRASASRLRELAGDLRDRDRPASASHPDLHHLCLLLAGACDETGRRALRRVPSPPGDEGRFHDYQRARARRMPLLWPAAERYANEALPGPRRHAVVTVPTGAGKSAVAELAAAQALQTGWVLYLAPTNALVAQIRRDLTRSFAHLGVAVRGLTGGAEYTLMAGETLDLVGPRQIAVMTPEKCSLALRQSSELFASLALCVMDEAHLIGDPQSRGVVAELVLAEILHRSPAARLLLLSALVANPDQLADWLTEATGTEAVAIDEPWRPTRTLRALCGIDAAGASTAVATALQSFTQLPPRRVNVQVDLPLRLLGALHGTWTGEDLADYEIVDTGLTVPSQADRRGHLPRTGHTAPATRVLTQALAEAGHRLLVFLPGDRHAPFAYAAKLAGPGLGRSAPRPDVASLLTLADAELAGVGATRASALHEALDKQIALHTSAMIVEEQRASEIAFETEGATVMLATGTLAQGLNLPATAVVIGGTSVGDRREANTAEGIARTKAQLLNAIGRAGRAQTAARSLAIVVPGRPVYIADRPDVAAAREAAPFLAEEDGSTAVESPLQGLIAEALGERLQMETMSVPEQTAFAFLSFTAESGDATAVLARSLAAHSARAADHAERVTDTLRALGRRFLDRAEAGAWIATAAHRAGIALPAAVALERPLRTLLSHGPPSDVGEWALALVRLLMTMSDDDRRRLLEDGNLKSTAVAAITSAAVDERRVGWTALARTQAAWLEGEPLTEVGARLHGADEPIGLSRSKSAPLPRTLRFVRNALERDMTTIAGAVVATVATGAESDAAGPWSLPPESSATLMRLPVAIRTGAANSPALALMQAGLRPRVAAHLLARLAPPDRLLADDALRGWASRTLADLETIEFVDAHTSDPRERALLVAAAHARSIS